jgi:hypothetical protein
MIYLIDDKRVRQESHRWNGKRFENYPGLFKIIHSHNEIGPLIQLIESSTTSSEDMVFIHDSFFQNAVPSLSIDMEGLRSALFEFAASNPKSLLVFFTGSISGMTLKGNILHIPVSKFYRNLEYFVDPSKLSKRDPKYLMFGERPEKEERMKELFFEADDALGNPIHYAIDSKNLFFRSSEINIRKPIPQGHYKEVDLVNYVEDEQLSPKLDIWLEEEEYDNIFIPVFYGPVLSDFDGLRLALHIRCTPSRNRLKPIYIYSFVDHSELLDNPCYDVLKTKNVFLIAHTREAIKAVLERKTQLLKIDELPSEIRKVNLSIPDDYDDSHRLTNEWAIVRWAKSIGLNNDKIQAIESKESRSLYFKYLSTIHPLSVFKIAKLHKKENKGEIRLIHIDDDAHKGWDTVIDSIVKTNFPEWKYQCISSELIPLSREEIVKYLRDVIAGIKDKRIIILLDFRLHEEDINESDPLNVTGVRILESIKNRRNGINRGIQVVMFSATEKISNYIKFRDICDGFIGKESPWNSASKKSTIETIESLIKELKRCASLAYLKTIWQLKIEIMQMFPENILKLKEFKGLRDFERMRIESTPKLIRDELEVMFEMLSSKNKDKFNIATIILNKILEYLNSIFYEETGMRKKDVPKIIGGGHIRYYDKDINDYFVAFDPGALSEQQPLVRGNHLKLEQVSSVSNKAIYLNFYKTGVVDKDLYSSIKSLTEKRNNYIHPNAKNEEPINSSDIEEWTASLHRHIAGLFGKPMTSIK